MKTLEEIKDAFKAWEKVVSTPEEWAAGSAGDFLGGVRWLESQLAQDAKAEPKKGEWKRIEVKSLEELPRLRTYLMVIGSQRCPLRYTDFDAWMVDIPEPREPGSLEWSALRYFECGCPIYEWVEPREPMTWEYVGSVGQVRATIASPHLKLYMPVAFAGKRVKVTVEEVIE